MTDYTTKEYNAAKARVERRLVIIEGTKYFPLKKDMFVVYGEDLILKTIYGKQVADTFLKNLIGIKDLIKDCQQQSKTTGIVTAIDGRKLTSRSPHSALNLLLQGSAGVIAKKWMVNFHQLAEDSNIPHGKNWKQETFVHDEYQCSVAPWIADKLGSIIVEGCLMIQDQYKTNLPIEADFSTGLNWSETH